MFALRIIPLVAFVLINTTVSSTDDNCLQSPNDRLLYQSFEKMQSWFRSNLNDAKVESIEKMETVEETLNVTKHELEETKTLVNKLESQLKEYHNSEKLFESLKKWVNNNQAETNVQSNLRFAKLEETVTANTHNLNILKEFVTVNTNNLNILKDSLSKYQNDGKLLALQQSVDQLRGKINNVEKIHQQMDVLQKEMKATLGHQLSLIQKQESATRNVENAASNCITDIKVSHSGYSWIHKGPGFNDEGHHGYFITGVANGNSDIYVDVAFRRRILFNKNNNWVPVHE